MEIWRPNWDELRSEALHACRLAAPELADLPIYVVFNHELPSSVFGAGFDGLCGFTGPHVDLAISAHLANGWLGRGPAAILYGERILRNLVDPAREAVSAIQEVAIHEICHVLSDQYDFADIESSSETIQEATNHIATCIAMPADLIRSRQRLHEPRRFVRCVIHAIRRLYMAGIDLCFPSVSGLAPDVGWRRLCKLESALGDEPERLAGLTFADILKHRTPEEYDRLCDDFDCVMKSELEPKAEGIANES